MFCGNRRRFTQEHVIPRWVRDVLKTGPVTIIDHDTGARLQYDETLTLVVNGAVCRQCNQGGLKRLGERVKLDVTGMIRGETVALTRTHATYLATWVTERALLIALARHEARDDVAINWTGDRPAASFRWLHANSDDPAPPPGTQVWLAYLDAMTNLPAWSLMGTWPESLEEPDGYLCAVSIGCLLFFAFGQNFRESDHRTPDGRSLGHLELPSGFGGYVVPIWPDPDKLIVWPPKFGFSNSDLATIAKLLMTAVVRRERLPRPIPVP